MKPPKSSDESSLNLNKINGRNNIIIKLIGNKIMFRKKKFNLINILIRIFQTNSASLKSFRLSTSKNSLVFLIQHN